MVLGVVFGLKSVELVMAGVVGGHCTDMMADRLPRYNERRFDDGRGMNVSILAPSI